MPKEVKSPEEFLNIAERAKVCRVKRLEDRVKLKLRTSRYLYTYVAKPDEADKLLKKIKCPIEEID